MKTIEIKRKSFVNHAIKYPVIDDKMPYPNAIDIIKIAPWLDDISRLYYAGTASIKGNNDDKHIPKVSVVNEQANPGKPMAINEIPIIVEKQSE